MPMASRPMMSRHAVVGLVWALTAIQCGVGAAAQGGPRVVQVGSVAESTAQVWLETSLKRVFPHTPPASTELSLLAARNGRLSFLSLIHI